MLNVSHHLDSDKIRFIIIPSTAHFNEIMIIIEVGGAEEETKRKWENVKCNNKRISRDLNNIKIHHRHYSHFLPKFEHVEYHQDREVKKEKKLLFVLKKKWRFNDKKEPN